MYICRILRVYPRGSDAATRDKYLSLYLELKNCGPNRSVYATYTLKIVDQRHNVYHQKTGTNVVYQCYIFWGHFILRQ